LRNRDAAARSRSGDVDGAKASSVVHAGAHNPAARQRRVGRIHDAGGAVKADVCHFVVGKRSAQRQGAGVGDVEGAGGCNAASKHAGAGGAVLQAARKHGHVGGHINAAAGHQHQVAGARAANGLGRGNHVAGDQGGQLAGVVGKRAGRIDGQVAGCTYGDVALAGQCAARFDVDVTKAQCHQVAGAGGQ